MSDVFMDTLPDQTCYRDEGCAAAPCCLDCPFPRCLEELPRAKQRAATGARAREMKALRDAGRSCLDIACAFSVSLRTVQRALQKSGENGAPSLLIKVKEGQ